MKKTLFLLIAIAIQTVVAFAQMNVNVTPTKHVPCDSCVTLSATVTGGSPSYTYQWYINNHSYTTGQTINYCNNNVFTFSGDTIKLIVTDANAQQANYFSVVSDLLSSTIPIGYSLCMATVDSATGKNLLIWEQTTNPSVASYNIYKQNTSSVFAVIANIPRNSFSTFIDTSSNPAQVSSMYAISVVDSCGFESSITTTGTPITTIHLAISAGISHAWNLAWNSTQGYPIVKYRIWRGTTLNNPVLIDSVANAVFSYTDLTPPDGVLYYTIEAVSTVLCNPSMKTNSNNPYSSSFSNVAKNGVAGVNEYYKKSTISISPNPSRGKFMITMENGRMEDGKIAIYNVLGERVYSEIINNQSTIINLSALPAGIYFLQVNTGEGTINRKLVLEK